MAVLFLAGCGAGHVAARKPHVLAATTEHCTAGARPVGSARRAYVGVAPDGAVAYRTPGGAVVARFGKVNVNGYQASRSTCHSGG